jgi:O-acetyl-ADP-ribose deacetylase (regulator of RNase III)
MKERRTSIAYLKGDATAPVGDGHRIICHVCNDIGGWGRGFVLALSQRWPEPERKYRAWHERGEDFALGAIQLVDVAPSLSVANMIAQHGVSAKNGVPPIRYDALARCLAALTERAKSLDASVHMPRIGCGLAGGTWPEVQAIVESTLCAGGVSVHVYDL